MKFRRIVKEDIGGSFHDPWVIKKICERGRVTQEDIDSVKKWYDYEMRFPTPFLQNAHVMKDLCEDIFNMWEHRGGLNERQMREVEEHISEGKRTHLAGLQEYLKALVSIASIMVADNADLRDGYAESAKRGQTTNMKWKRLTRESSKRYDMIEERNKLEKEIDSKDGLLKALYTVKHYCCNPTTGDSSLLEKCTRWLELERDIAVDEVSSMYGRGGGNWTGD